MSVDVVGFLIGIITGSLITFFLTLLVLLTYNELRKGDK